ncbi:Ppx/GppA family phosphatase [Virgibacillus sp. NKC19-16]|uniref:Ppx/GppA family phosphatase n=1 Tax=Virgibacillus salidurans TaxID=2831673 RepID=UPI001F33AA53|nr:Ppx/GppA family phosphatase [Virgibacillus sp. NKC19-16]UJL45677.1 Ppx/GppA family phosphatase [Virgibacillus sp. NKC19-16]
MQKRYYSIIDIGSNSMRLVIYVQQNSGRLHEVENVKAVARLRNYLDDDQMLTQVGIDILIDTLKSFKEVLKTYQLTNFVCAATATIRQAENKQDLKKMVKEQIGWEMWILSEQKEAYYGYLAVVNSTSITEGVTVDIGGGSTEVTYFKDRKLMESYSFGFGALTLKEFISPEKSLEKGLANMREYIYGQFSTYSWLKDRNIPLIGIGGSARNMAQIDQNMNKYPLAGLHQYKMNGSDIAKISNYLSSLSWGEMQKVEGLSKDRSDSILPAVEVFHCLFQTIQADCFVLSRKGLRDGIFYEQLYQDHVTPILPNVLEDSIQELINDYSLNVKQISHVQYLTRKLFNNLQAKGMASLTKQDWQMLELASNVFYLGDYIDSESSSQHTFYLLANRTIDGIMHVDRLKLALVASFKNKTIFKQFLAPFKHWFLKEERKKLRMLGAMLKFTYSLDATKRQVVQDFYLKVKGDTIHLTLHCNNDYMPEAYQAEKQKKHLEKMVHKHIELTFTDIRYGVSH